MQNLQNYLGSPVEKESSEELHSCPLPSIDNKKKHCKGNTFYAHTQMYKEKTYALHRKE